jgi:uncharacterized lipoprotein YddW (UPF0748 family)
MLKVRVAGGLLAGSLLLGSPLLSAQEMRAAWVASVFNINFPSRSGISESAQKAQIRAIVNAAARAGLNALMVQVRPEGDALYESRYEPWSRFLTGTQGASPGYDPLETFITEGRAQGIGIHAWINPYRAAANASTPRASSHVTRRLNGSVRRISSLLWLDPGDPAVRAHVARVVQDIVERYPVAGIVIDDYFYPYPSKSYRPGAFPDRATYAAYGGGLAIGDWRRQNVNRLVRDLSATIKQSRPKALFGVSPFGIYRKGEPPDVEVELDQYRDLYSDPVAWLRNGWVDYLSPQLYWRDGGAQSFSSLLRWWRSPPANPRGIPIYPSIALERMGAGYGWPSAEIARQLRIEASLGPRNGGGFILWNVGALLRNQKGVVGVIAAAAR